MSEPGRDPTFLGHMLQHARKAVTRTETVTREDFDASEDLRIVLSRLIQIIGEAARKVSKPTREAHP